MPLNDEDKNEIIKQLGKVIANELHESSKSLEDKIAESNKGWTQEQVKQRALEIKRDERIQYLQKQYDEGKETLAERLELMQTNFKKNLDAKISPAMQKQIKETAETFASAGKTAAQTVGSLAKGAVSIGTGAVSGAANSKLGNSSIEALMYSNPLTAMIYQNRDLLQTAWKTGTAATSLAAKTAMGLGKAGAQLGKGAAQLGWLGVNAWYNNRKRDNKKPAKESQSTSLIPFQDSDGIINAEVISSSTSKNTSKPALTNKLLPRLPKLKKDPQAIEMTKGIKELNKNSKQTNEHLKKTGAKVALVVVGVIALLAALKGLAGLLNKNIEDHSFAETPTVDPKQQAQNFEQQSKLTTDDYTQKISDSLKNEQHISKYDEMQKVSPWLKTTTTDANGKKTTTHYGATNSGWKAYTKEDAPYRAPFNMKILGWKVNSKKSGIVNLKAEKIVPHGINRNIELMNVKNPTVLPGEMVEKNQIIGFVGPTGQIQIKDISKDDFKDYIKNVNDIVAGNTKNLTTNDMVSPEKTKDLNDMSRYISTATKFEPNGDVTLNERKVKDFKNQDTKDAYTEKESKNQQQIAQGRQKVDQEFQETLKGFKAEADSKNAKKAIQNTKTNTNPSSNPSVKPVKSANTATTRPTNVGASAGSTINFGINSSADFMAAHSQPVTLQQGK